MAKKHYYQCEHDGCNADATTEWVEYEEEGGRNGIREVRSTLKCDAHPEGPPYVPYKLILG